MNPHFSLTMVTNIYNKYVINLDTQLMELSDNEPQNAHDAVSAVYVNV